MNSAPTDITIKERLSDRLHKEDIQELLHYMKNNPPLREAIYQLTLDKDDKLSYKALWICTHFPPEDMLWLETKREQLIDSVLTSPHPGTRRMVLSILCQQQQISDSPRLDLLDYCLQGILSNTEPAGVKALCIKLAYQLTLSIPELQQELYLILEMMEPDLLTPAFRSTRKNTLKAIKSKRRKSKLTK